MSHADTAIVKHPAPPATITVHVDAEDLLLGVRRNGRECPIARATRRTLLFMGLTNQNVLVGGVANGNSVVEIGRVMYRDEAIPEFISCFDSDCPVQPTTFTLVRL